MNASLGDAAVLLGLLGALAGAVTTGAGLLRGRDRWVRAGRSYVWVVAAGAALATAALERALITHDYTLQYVGNNDGNATPLLYRITAMWSALEGSMLLWALVLAGYLVAMVVHFRRRADDPLVAWATTIGFGVASFFFAVLLVVSNPFATYAGAVPTNGPGPDPLLQDHVLVAFHPPMLYLGLVGFTVPFCFAAASLITGRVGEGWLLETRRWTLFAWAFLTAGIVLGAWWSYQVLGWGGFWAWDPVENSAFIPWLTATAFLHSVMVQERRGMLRVWNLSLVLATFSLTILGTFLTRSGLLASVHSFSVSSIGPVLLGFFGVVVAGAVALIAWRGDLLRSSGTIDSPVSREGAFLANNLLFSLFALVVLLGTVFPLIASSLRGSSVTVGAPYFDELTLPIVICLLFLMAVAPVLPWRKASGELLRTRLQWPLAAAALTLGACVAGGVRGLAPLAAFGLGAFAGGSAGRQLVLAVRRSGPSGLVGRVNGGMVVHLGVVVVAVAFAASHSYTRQTTLSLRPGQTGAFAGHRYTFLGMRSTRAAVKSTLSAEIAVDGGQVYAPAISTYPFAAEAVGTPSVRSSLGSDLYLTITNPPAGPADPVTIGVSDEPLVDWVWVGGGVMLLGTLLAAFPGRRRRPTDPVSAPSRAEGAPLDAPVPEPALARRATRLAGPGGAPA
ncbi:MAG TPA: cytochrome c-type biogenesis CcmF C-terminal domain-containing protein [Acidimicrobiales bacterium]|nr:cytochrome c-type biogenesis CcmF C-terminal domain-containing protein [Acidimicrobiales bacterium]